MSALARPIGSNGWRVAAALAAAALTLALVAVVMAPWFADLTSYGFHDWDAETSFRYLTRLSLLRYHELPWWNPYACGGYPSWGYVEGATTVVSPWLPFYLWAPLPLAIRVEAAGMGLLGAAGAYAWGSRFTASHAARLLPVALWAVNGRWGLQTASGHTWHLAYAWLPWCGFFFERALAEPCERAGKVVDLGLLGGCFAMLVYGGGIYPLPHTVLALGSYALVRAVLTRRIRPLYVLAAGGIAGIGLGAPKLLPVLSTFGVDRRLTASTETLSPGALLTLLTHPFQSFDARPAAVRPYGWHEWGMYISWAGVAVLLGALLLVEGRRERALKATGVLFGLFGLGAFHPQAPWTLAHAHLPIFSSQHVPSRFLYPAVLLLALVGASGLGRWVDRRARRRPWLDLVLLGGVGALGVDVALVAEQPMRQAMWMQPPPIAARSEFSFARQPPYHYRKRDWAGPMLLSMLANTGVIDCYGVPRAPDRPPGAIARDDRARYRGEAYLVAADDRPAPGHARVVEWTPSSATIALAGATPGSLLVYNMNHWRGWTSDRGPIVAYRGALAVRLSADGPVGEVRLRYRPPGLGLGLGLAAATMLLLVLGWRRQRLLAREGP